MLGTIVELKVIVTEYYSYCYISLCEYSLLHLGKPAKMEGDVDYVPSIFCYTKIDSSTTQSKIRRHQRLMHRRKLVHSSEQQRTFKHDFINVGADSNVQATVEVSFVLHIHYSLTMIGQ